MQTFSYSIYQKKNFKRRLAELEEKYTKHAIFQTQFENDNQKLLYEVDILKDIIEENEELIIELRRQFKEKSRVCLPLTITH